MFIYDTIVAHRFFSLFSIAYLELALVAMCDALSSKNTKKRMPNSPNVVGICCERSAKNGREIEPYLKEIRRDGCVLVCTVKIRPKKTRPKKENGWGKQNASFYIFRAPLEISWKLVLRSLRAPSTLYKVLLYSSR